MAFIGTSLCTANKASLSETHRPEVLRSEERAGLITDIALATLVAAVGTVILLQMNGIISLPSQLAGLSSISHTAALALVGGAAGLVVLDVIILLAKQGRHIDNLTKEFGERSAVAATAPALTDEVAALQAQVDGIPDQCDAAVAARDAELRAGLDGLYEDGGRLAGGGVRPPYGADANVEAAVKGVLTHVEGMGINAHRNLALVHHALSAFITDHGITVADDANTSMMLAAINAHITTVTGERDATQAALVAIETQYDAIITSANITFAASAAAPATTSSSSSSAAAAVAPPATAPTLMDKHNAVVAHLAGVANTAAQERDEAQRTLTALEGELDRALAAAGVPALADNAGIEAKYDALQRKASEVNNGLDQLKGKINAALTAAGVPPLANDATLEAKFDALITHGEGIVGEIVQAIKDAAQAKGVPIADGDSPQTVLGNLVVAFDGAKQAVATGKAAISAAATAAGLGATTDLTVLVGGLADKVQAAEDTRVAASTQADDLQKQLTTATQRADAAEQTAARAEAAKATLAAELTAATTRADDAETEAARVAKLQERVDDLTTRLTAAEKKAVDAEAALETATTDHADALQKASAKAERDVKQIQAKLDTANGALRHAQQKVSQLEGAAAAAGARATNMGTTPTSTPPRTGASNDDDDSSSSSSSSTTTTPNNGGGKGGRRRGKKR